jgi:hypothetical protein
MTGVGQGRRWSDVCVWIVALAETVPNIRAARGVLYSVLVEMRTGLMDVVR